MKWKIEGVRTRWDRYKYAALVGLIGAGLLLWPSGEGRTPSAPAAESQSVRDLQSEMEEILGMMSGVGQVRVLLTEDSDGQRREDHGGKLEVVFSPAAWYNNVLKSLPRMNE